MDTKKSKTVTAKNVGLTLRVSREEYETIRAASNRAYMSMNGYIRKVVLEHIKRGKK